MKNQGVTITQTAEELISDLAESLEISERHYESAERSYKSVSAWLDRPDSRFARTRFNVYTQGSFRLGTAIRPFSGSEDYDLDIVCEFSKSKLSQTQKKLFEDLGHELQMYAHGYGLEPPSPWRRCWTLNYADDAQFHMDVLPCVPDGQRQRRVRAAAALSMDHVEKSVSITDKEHENYGFLTEEWPVSNPNGYADWFYARMKTAFESKRRAMMVMEKRADVSQIPAFRVKTPLQAAIQILKHHRNRRFSEETEGKPSSIVITTLAAAAYGEESTITGALFSILSGMECYIEQRNGEYWIANPSDPRENFAEFWNDDQKLRDGFYDWLQTARTDFDNAAQQNDVQGFIDALSPRMGRDLVEKAAGKRNRNLMEKSLVRTAAGALQRVLDAPHRKPVAWPKVQVGKVNISAMSDRNGFRAAPFRSDAPALEKGSKLTFYADTDISRPYKVFWQVVNTGGAAKDAKDLRGGFEEIAIEQGKLTKHETARYHGIHSIECFIVKDEYCVGWSGPFLVNIG